MFPQETSGTKSVVLRIPRSVVVVLSYDDGFDPGFMHMQGWLPRLYASRPMFTPLNKKCANEDWSTTREQTTPTTYQNLNKRKGGHMNSTWVYTSLLIYARFYLSIYSANSISAITYSHAILPPFTSNPLPTVLLILPTFLLQAHTSLNPVLTSHLAQPTQCSRESKPLFVTREYV